MTISLPPAADLIFRPLNSSVRHRISRNRPGCHDPGCHDPACKGLGHRRAFTLLEMLVSIAVLAMIASVVMPPAMVMLSDRRLNRGGDQVRNELANIRLDAMRSGQVMMLSGNPGDEQLTVAAYFGGNAATEGNTVMGPSALTMGGKQASITAIPVPTDAGRTIELPETIRLTEIRVMQSQRSAMINSTLINPSSMGGAAKGGATPTASSIYFYPDGTTSDAVVRVQNRDGETLQISLRGVTGHTEIFDGPPVAVVDAS